MATSTTIWCLHGAVGAATDWLPFRQQWEKAGHELRAVDLWRFLDCCPKSLADTATALNAEVAANPGRNVMVAYSMGGRIGLHALLAENSPWQAAVIIAAHPGLESEQEKMQRRSIDTNWSAKSFHGDWSSFLQDWQAQSVLQKGGGMTTEWSDRGSLHLRRKEISRSFLEWSLGVQESLWPRLGEIQVPMLWLTGEHDVKFSALAQRACELIPDASHRLIQGAGHRLPWQQPQVFTEMVLDFL